MLGFRRIGGPAYVGMIAIRGVGHLRHNAYRGWMFNEGGKYLTLTWLETIDGYGRVVGMLRIWTHLFGRIYERKWHFILRGAD